MHLDASTRATGICLESINRRVSTHACKELPADMLVHTKPEGESYTQSAQIVKQQKGGDCQAVSACKLLCTCSTRPDHSESTRQGCCAYLVLSSSADWSRTGSLAGRGLGVRARGPVDTELIEPSGVRDRGEQGSMKACDPMGVISVEPGVEAGCHVCISKACCDKSADTAIQLVHIDFCCYYAREASTEQVLQQQKMMPHKNSNAIQ